MDLSGLLFAPFRASPRCDLLLSSARMALPPLILKQLWEAGYGGKVIRVPVKNQRLELKVVANEILKDAERIYESKGIDLRIGTKREVGLLPLVRRTQTLPPISSKHPGSEESSTAGLFALEPLGAGV